MKAFLKSLSFILPREYNMAIDIKFNASNIFLRLSWWFLRKSKRYNPYPGFWKDGVRGGDSFYTRTVICLRKYQRARFEDWLGLASFRRVCPHVRCRFESRLRKCRVSFFSSSLEYSNFSNFHHDTFHLLHSYSPPRSCIWINLRPNGSIRSKFQ